MESEKKTHTNAGFKEAFANFFDNPDRSTLSQLFFQHTGENDDLDFKEDWIEPVELAKHILAMANTAGGVIIFGIKEDKTKNSFEPVGIDFSDTTKFKSLEKTAFERSLGHLLSDNLTYEVLDLSYPASEYQQLNGKNFRIVLVKYDARYIPHLPKKESGKMKKTDIYIRDNSSSSLAEDRHLQDIFNRRLATDFSSAREISLEEHFQELRKLFSLIQPGEWVNLMNEVYADEFLRYEDPHEFRKNPKYPEEDFEDFVIRMIALKKSVIEIVVKARK